MKAILYLNGHRVADVDLETPPTLAPSVENHTGSTLTVALIDEHARPDGGPLFLSGRLERA